MATGVLNPAERAMQSSMTAANLEGAAGDLHAEPTMEEIAGRGERNTDEIRRALAQTKDPQARAILLAEMQNNPQDFGGSAAAGGTAPADDNPFAAFAKPQSDNPFAAFAPAKPAAPAAKPKQGPGIASDTGNMLGAGSVGLVRDANEAVRKIPVVGDAIGSALDAGANALKSDAEKKVDAMGNVGAKPLTVDGLLKQYQQDYQDRLSPEQKTALSKDWISEDKDGMHIGPAFTDPRSYFGGMVESIPANVMLILPAMAVARGVYATRLSALMKGGMAEEAATDAASKFASKTAAVAGSLTEGLQQAGDSSISVREQIQGMTPDQLKGSDAFQSLMRNGHMTFEQARAKLADDASTKAFVLAGIATAAFSGAGDYMLAKILTKGVQGGVLKRAGLGALSEGALEEFPQNYLSQMGENAALQSATPDQSLTAGAMNQAVGGAMQGAGMGAAVGGAFGHRAEAPKPAPEKPTELNFGDGKVINNAKDLEATFASMAHNERQPAFMAAVEQAYGVKHTDEERKVFDDIFAHVPISEQGAALGEIVWPAQEKAQEPAGEPQQETAPAAPVSAKDITRVAKKRLDALHKQAEEARPQASHIGDDGKLVYTPGTGNHLTPEQQTEYDFVTKNMQDPAALAKFYNATLGEVSPAKVKPQPVQEGGAAVTDAVRAAKGQSNITDTIERNNATAEKDVAKAREAQKVVEPEAAKPAAPVDTRPQPAAAVKAMEGDAAAIIGKRAPAASSRIAGTVAQATKTLEGESQKTEAHKRAVEKSKALAAKKAAPQVVEQKSPAAAATTPSVASTADTAAPAKAAPKKEPESAPVVKAKAAPQGGALPATPGASGAGESRAAAATVQKPAASTEREQPAKVNTEARRAKDFNVSGNYEIEVGGKMRKLFRDPENKSWYEDGTGKHYTENWLGFSKVEAIERINKKYAKPAPSTIKPELGTKGKAAVATSKAKETINSKADKVLLKEVRDVLKNYPDTTTPIALVRKELGLDHATAKAAVEQVQGKKKEETPLARKFGEPTSERRVSVGLGAGPGSPMEKTLAGREIPRSYAHGIIDATAQRLGIRILEKQDGAGAYLATPEGAIQIDAGTTFDVVKQFIASLAYQLQQREVIAVKPAVGGKSHAIDIYAPAFESQDVAQKFWDNFNSLQGKDTLVWGYQQAKVDGKPAVRFLNFGDHWSDDQVKSISNLIGKAADEAGIEIGAEGHDDYPIDLESSLNEWSEESGREGRSHLHSLVDAGGDREARHLLERGSSPQSAAEEVARVRTDLARKAEAAARVQPSTEAGDHTAGAELARAVGSYFGGDEQAREVLDVVPAHTTEARLAVALAKRFGQNLFFFRNSAPEVFDFDGAAPDGSKSIFINTLNERPLMSVLGHELLHRMRQSDERSYQALLQALQGYFNDAGKTKHAEALRKALTPGERLADTKIMEEYVADIVGEAFADPEFFRQLADRNPGFFQRVLDVILKLLHTALDFTTNPEHSEYLNNVREARGVVADAMAQWAALQISPLGADGIRVYRGAASGLSKRSFNRDRLGGSSGRAPSGLGVFFSTSRDYAAKYGHVETFTANLKNPYRIKVDQLPIFETVDEAYGYRENLREQGHDGVIIQADHLGGANTIVAFAPESVSNADGTDLARRGLGVQIEDDRDVVGHPTLDESMALLSPQEVQRRVDEAIRDLNLPKADNVDLARKMQPQINSLQSAQAQNINNNPAAKRHLELTMGTRVLDMINRWVGDKLSPLGNLPFISRYMSGRGTTQGSVAAADAEAREFHKIFTKATDEQKKRIKQYLTNRGVPKAIIGDAALADSAEKLKKRLIDIGADLVKHGVITQKDYDANKGMYLPRLYLRYLLDEAAFRGVGTGKKLSDLGYSKRRKDISEEYRRAILGEIDDPAVLGAIALSKPLRDIAILDFMHQISQDKEWVWAPSMTTHNGQQVSVAWVKNEIDRIREQKAYYKDAKDIANADKAIASLEQTLQKATAAAGGKAPENFKEIPDTPRYGYLRGMYVRAEIHDDLVGAAHTTPDDWAQHLFGSGGMGTKMVQMWKASKVSLNPPAQIRNLISNFMLLHLSGVAMHRMPGRIAQAINAMIEGKGNKFYDIAQKYGVTVSTFAAQELYKIRDEFLQEQGKGGPLAFFRYGKMIVSHFGDAYQAMETLGKLTKIIDEMESYGQAEADAALEANKWLFDYSLVPGAVRSLRNLPLGMPFVTFYYKLAPRMLEVALKYPWRFAPYVGAMWLIPQMFAAMGGPSPDDQEKLKRTLVQRLREKGHVYILPYKDEHGNWTALDLSYFVPYTMFTDAAKEIAEGRISDLVKTVGLFSGPFVDLPTAILTNKDPFTGRDISNAGDPTGLQVGSWLTYLYNMAMPPIITNQNLIGPDLGNPNHVVSGRLPSALYGVTNKYGDPRNTVSQALLGAAGMSVYPFNPAHSRASEIKRMQFEMQQATMRLHAQLQDKGLTPEERLNVARSYQEEIRRRAQKMREYAASTAIPSGL